MQEALIHDESGDRKYFTQLPNMIVNHSTAYEQSLYWIMKRFAGERGICFCSLNELARKMGTHKTTTSNTIKKLLKRKWIKEIDQKKVKGGYVRQFVIVDLWALNIQMYEGGAQMTTSQKNEGGAQMTEGGANIDGSGANIVYEEDLVRRFKEEDLLAADAAKNMKPVKNENDFGDDGLPEIDATTGERIQVKPLKPALPVLDLLRLFAPVNPSYYLFTRNNTEISSIKRLRDQYGADDVAQMIKGLAYLNTLPYAPVATSPNELEKKMGRLQTFVAKLPAEQQAELRKHL